MIIVFNISEAASIIYLLLKNPPEGKKKKKIFDQDVGLLETCFESVPSACIITVIWLKTGRFIRENMNRIFCLNFIHIIFLIAGFAGDINLRNIIFNPSSPSLFTEIFCLSPGEFVAHAEFFTTYIISVISAALGLAKCLKNGVARPIAPGGTLDGLLTGKFLFAFLASALVLVTRGVCIAISLVTFTSYLIICE